MGLGDFFGGLFGGPELPGSNEVAKAETPTVDSVHPRSLCLGNGAWEASLVWRQSHNFSTNALEPKEALTDVMAVGDHPMGAQTHLWVDDDRWSIGTDAGASGDHFIPASLAGDWSSEVITADWYVPNINKTDDTDAREFEKHGGDGVRRPALMFQFFDGTQTDLTGAGGDSWLKIVPGWTDQARAGNRVSLLGVTWRFGINDRVAPSGRPSLLLEGAGATEVYDWRTSTTGFSNNAALCLAHTLMWEYFPWQRVDASWTNVRLTTASFDTAAMQAAADLCDETDAAFTGVRYNCSYQMMADMDPEQIIEDFLLAMGGAKIFLRQGKIVILPGGPRSWVVGFDLEDLSAHQAIVTPTKRARRSRYNAVRPEYRTLNGGWQFTDADLVAPAAYLNDDEGRRRTKKLRFNAIGGSAAKERSQRLGKIWLDRHRLEDRATLAVHALLGVDTSGNLGGALRAEEGDIARLTYSRKGWTDKLFEVASREWDAGTHTFVFDLEEWSDAIDWDGEGTVPDEALERGEFRGGKLAPVENVVWADKPRSTTLASGQLLVDGVLSWTAHPDTLVDDIGGYRIRYRETTDSDWISVSSKTNFRQINNLRRAIEHKAQVSAQIPGADSEWAPDPALTFTPTSNDLPTTPPRLPGEGQNLIEGGTFEHPQHDVNFLIIDARADGTTGKLESTNVTATFAAVGGLYGPRCMQIIESPSTEPSTDTWRIGYEPYIPVEPGQIIKMGVSAINLQLTGNLDADFVLTNRFYDEDKVFTESQTLDGTFSAPGDGTPIFVKGKTQAPAGSVFCRPQIVYVKSSDVTFSCGVKFDGWYADEVNLIQSPLSETEQTVPDANHVQFGLGNRDIAAQGFITNGTEELAIEWQGRHKVIHADNTNALSARTEIRSRLVRHDFNEVLSDVIVTGLRPVVGLPLGAATALEETEYVMFRFASEDAPPEGEWIYRIETSLAGDVDDADGVVSDRKIEIRRI